MTCPDAITFFVHAELPAGFSACWDDPGGGGITTCGSSLDDLQAEIFDAVRCHFGPDRRPNRIRLHFTEDVVMTSL